MKYKVVISKEIIYEKIIFADSEDEAEELANAIFENEDNSFEEVDAQFDILEITETK